MPTVAPASTRRQLEARTSHHQATVVVAVLSPCWGATRTGASSVMLTRVTVVVRGVRLATPSLACSPYPSLRPGVRLFASFSKDSNRTLATDPASSLLAPAPG